MIQFKSQSTKNTVEDVLKKSVIAQGFEQLHSVPVNHRSEKWLRRQRKKEREQTKGKDWYNIPATKQTEEVRKDLELLQMRAALDPKRFYKHNDMKTLPKYFQIGHIVDSSADFYSSRIPKKERKPTLVEELLADAELKKYTKRKYHEIIHSDPRRKQKAMKHAKKLKRMKRR